jgi:drug/metabolite transporter (DMT)-like permease
VAVLVARRERLRELLPYWRQGLYLAFFGIIGDQILFLFGLKNTTASHGALMYILVPVLVAVFAHFMIGERIGWIRIAGIALSFAGAFLLVSEEGLTFESRYLAGDLMVLGAAVCWSLYVVLSKPVVEKLGTSRTMGLLFIFALPLSLPLTIPGALAQPWGRVTQTGIASVAYIIIGGTFLGYLCYQFALKKLPASAVAPFSYTVPIVVGAFSVPLLGEAFSPRFFSAAALIFAGIILAQLRRRRRAIPSAMDT